MNTLEQRYSLLGPPSLQYLLKRGKAATEKWSQVELFEEKQNDTAEIVVIPSKKLVIEVDHVRPVTLIDVKTQDVGKKAQAPNIISAEKVANVCKLAIESENFLPFEILYVGIKWQATKTELVCTDVRIVSLTDIDPKNLYINWAAALQIQFHPFEVPTSYTKDGMSWARDYLKNFCAQLERRIENERVKLETFRSVV
jgi:type II restriction enzyme